MSTCSFTKWGVLSAFVRRTVTWYCHSNTTHQDQQRLLSQHSVLRTSRHWKNYVCQGWFKFCFQLLYFIQMWPLCWFLHS